MLPVFEALKTLSLIVCVYMRERSRLLLVSQNVELCVCFLTVYLCKYLSIHFTSLPVVLTKRFNLHSHL